MVELYLDNKKINYRDWELFESKGILILKVIYPSGKCYYRPFHEWKVFPINKIESDLLIHTIIDKTMKIFEAYMIGKKYYIIKESMDSNWKVFNVDEANIIKSTDMKDSNIFKYFIDVATERVKNASNDISINDTESILRQLHQLVPYPDTALQAYLSKKVRKYKGRDNIIYPFGVNETQMEAISNAFSSQISVIEGPPGTGKTQTILNIIANIIVNGEVCAIVSNNNMAVENVYEKFENNQLGFLIAKLGNSKKISDFFENMNYKKTIKEIDEINIEKINELREKVSQHLKNKNELAIIQNTIREIEIEKQYLIQWCQDNPDIHTEIIDKYKLSSKNSVELLTYLKYLPYGALTLKNKIELLIHYRMIKSKFLNNLEDRQNFIYSLQLTFYEKLLEEHYKRKEELEKILEFANFDRNLKNLTAISLEFLYQYVNMKLPNIANEFNPKNYKKCFSEFVSNFPVIGSSTHSLLSSIANGYLFDYVIIDEASQQDIIPGILCLGCAKNVIIVGDRKQLPHIPIPTKLICKNKEYDCSKYSLLDSVCEVFKDQIPRTILKEHYRCQPRIIQFCNKQFYNDELIPMKQDTEENPLTLIVTTKGNHMRQYFNMREIESVLEAQDTFGFIGNDTGFIAPYNAQVDLSKKMLPIEVIKNTVHKFQGRECNNIIFSTVLDKKVVSKNQINFVDDAHLINVAVSRAIKKFVLVTGNDVFKSNNKYIASLIRYIQYYANKDQLYQSPVVSAFDLLYSEYDKSLEKLKLRLNPKDSKHESEQIVAALLKEIFQEENCRDLVIHIQVYLRQLISIENECFTDREIEFMKNGASCDFVLYYTIGKEPFAVIEVDGGKHYSPNNLKQQECDQNKNSILNKSNIPLLRITTIEGNTKEKLKDFIVSNLG